MKKYSFLVWLHTKVMYVVLGHVNLQNRKPSRYFASMTRILLQLYMEYEVKNSMKSRLRGHVLTQLAKWV